MKHCSKGKLLNASSYLAETQCRAVKSIIAVIAAAMSADAVTVFHATLAKRANIVFYFKVVL